MKNDKICIGCKLYNKRFVPRQILDNQNLNEQDLNQIDILFVGEAPGAQEEEQGAPFVGRSGELLREKIQTYLLSRYPNLKIAITNVVKCRPDNNATPDKNLVKKCEPYLEEDIRVLKPRIIVALGRVSLSSLIPELTSITKNVNMSFEKIIYGHHVIVIPTYHPSAILRDPTKLKDFEVTFSKVIPSVLEKSKSDKADFSYKVISTNKELSEVVNRIISSGKYFAFDIETFSLSPCENPYIISISLSVRYNDDTVENYAIPLCKMIGYVDDLRRLFSSDVGKIAHNAKFDMSFLHYSGIYVKNLIFDTIIGHHLYHEELPHSLDYLTVELTPFSEHKSAFWTKATNEAMKVLEEHISKGIFTDSDEEFLKSLLEYNAKDSYVTLLSYEKLVNMLNDEKKALMEYLLLDLSETLMDMELFGIKIDRNMLNSVKTEVGQQLASLKFKLNSNPVVIAYKEKNKLNEVNFNSTKQLSDILFKEMGLEQIKLTKKGAPSTSSDVLEILSSKSDFVKELLEYRRLTKLYTAFLDGMDEYVMSDGKIHPRFNITGTKTGRLSCESPNLQQIPKDSLVRRIFVPTYDYFVEADYSQLELRTTATISGDENLLRAFNNNEDLHYATASKIFNKPVEEITDEERRIAKSINFGVIYGISPEGLVDNLRPLGIDIKKEKAKEYIQSFFNAYPRVKMWIDLTRHVAMRDLVVHSLFGVERHIREANEAGLREAVNFVIQSSSAYMTFFALTCLQRRLKSKSFKSRLVLTIHDSIMLDVPKSELVPVLKLIKKCMVDIVQQVVDQYLQAVRYEEIVGRVQCPLDIEVEIMERWGEPLKSLTKQDIETLGDVIEI